VRGYPGPFLAMETSSEPRFIRVLVVGISETDGELARDGAGASTAAGPRLGPPIASDTIVGPPPSFTGSVAPMRHRRLPQRSLRSEPRRGRSNTELFMGRGASILIIEDDACVRDTLRSILEEEGFEVETAAGGREALSWLATRPPPSVILLDLMMPEMDGWGFLEAREKFPALARIPVALLTAARDAPVQRMLSSRVAAVLAKPLGLYHLINAIEHCTGASDRGAEGVPPGAEPK
jgi:CheY-like chemotaxis protein